MIKTEFSFFQMQIKGVFRHAIKLCESALGKAPERLDSINVAGRVGKFILAMLDAVMLVVADVYQAVIAAPAVAVNHAFGIHFASYNALKRLFTGIRDNFSVHVPLALEYAKDNRFARCSPATLAGNPSGTEVRFINFDRTGHRSLLLRPLGYLTTQAAVNSRDRTTAQAGQLGAVGSRKIHGKIPNQLPKFGLRNF